MKHFTNSFGVLSAFAVIIQAVLVSDESKLRSLCICQTILGSRAMMTKSDEEGPSTNRLFQNLTFWAMMNSKR